MAHVKEGEDLGTWEMNSESQAWPYFMGKFHNQGDAKWIVIRGLLRSHNDTLFKRPTPGWPISYPGVGPQGDWPPSGRMWCFLITIN
jgi:hypothetical protein